MAHWQQLIIITYGLLALYAFISGIYSCYFKHNAFQDTPLFGACFTAFVQADKVVFGLFWFLLTAATLLLDDWLLFLLLLSVFILVRSIGETLYWFLQQFHPRTGNQPEKFWYYRFFHNDSVWFVNQIYWQCVTVVTIVTTIYLINLWLSK